MGATVKDVAEKLGISRSKVYELIQTGQLESLAIGRVRRVSAAALEKFFAKPVEPGHQWYAPHLDAGPRPVRFLSNMRSSPKQDVGSNVADLHPGDIVSLRFLGRGRHWGRRLDQALLQETALVRGASLTSANTGHLL